MTNKDTVSFIIIIIIVPRRQLTVGCYNNDRDICSVCIETQHSEVDSGGEVRPEGGRH